MKILGIILILSGISSLIESCSMDGFDSVRFATAGYGNMIIGVLLGMEIKK